MKKALAVTLLGAIFLGAGGCSLHQSEPVRAPSPKTSESAEATPLELPVYEVIDQKEMQVPTAKLGEELRVGPVTVKVTLDGLTYEETEWRTADGRVWNDVNPYYGFRIEIHNNSAAVLDVHPRKTFWIANNSLLKSGPVSPLVNWFIIGRRPDGARLLVLPAPEMMKELGYQEHDIKVAKWAKDRLGLHPLPNEIGPGQSADGYIIFSYPSSERGLKEMGEDPDEHYYLFLGNWTQEVAWGRFDLGTLPELLRQLMDRIGPNRPALEEYLEELIERCREPVRSTDIDFCRPL